MAIDGKSLLRALREQLGEATTSEFIDDRTSYEYLYQAAMEFVARTHCLTAEQSITTVASQADYTLNANFMKLYLKDDGGKYYIKYNDGTSNTFIFDKSYESIIYGDNTTAVVVPDNYVILDDAKDTQIDSKATSNGDSSGGQCTLTDSGALFADVSAGDIVHNETDGSDGIVLSKTSSSAVVCALFGGTGNDWDTDDEYIIQPQARLKLKFSPPPSTASHTATVYYVQKPAPVFSSYGVYRFQEQYMQALVFYACWLYKYRDREANYGDRYYQFFEQQTKKGAKQLNDTLLRKGFKVNLLGGR